MKKLTWLLILLVIGISAFTHLYRIDKTFIFNGDEARDVLIVKKMIDTKRPVLLGPETSVGNMYLGPLYYYLMLPALLISHMQPVGPAVMVALFAIGTSVLLFIWGKRHFGVWGGTVAGLTYALIPIMVNYSRSSWNPNLVPFFMTILLFAYDAPGLAGWITLGLVAGVMFQLHYVALAGVGLIGLAMFVRDYRQHGLRFLKYVLLTLLGFLIVSAPFWLFEARHDWVDTHAFVTYLTVKQHETSTNTSYISRLENNIRLVGDGIIGSQAIALSPVPNALTIMTGLLLILFPLWFVGRREKDDALWLLWYVLGGTLMIVSFLKESIYVHYVSHLFPALALMFGALVSRSFRIIRLATIGFLIYLLVWSLPILRYNLFEIVSSQVDRAQHVASYIQEQAGGQKYNVVNTQGTVITPVQYFLSLSKNPPQNTLENLIFDICDGMACPADDETTILLFLTGPTHPAITEYLGHPQFNEFSVPRHIMVNKQVSYDTWVATIVLDH